jgi:hypothetical protein
MGVAVAAWYVYYLHICPWLSALKPLKPLKTMGPED